LDTSCDETIGSTVASSSPKNPVSWQCHGEMMIGGHLLCFLTFNILVLTQSGIAKWKIDRKRWFGSRPSLSDGKYDGSSQCGLEPVPAVQR
jgi:hypothetical protein